MFTDIKNLWKYYKTQHDYKYLKKKVNIRNNKLHKHITTMFKDSLTSNWIFIHKKAYSQLIGSF